MGVTLNRESEGDSGQKRTCAPFLKGGQEDIPSPESC